ncbi:MAG TPA: bifunctional diaminohydroxyphosphoribosylaminopyrimidine deaminase/5-amino-6-(5-phosphoribosylamino)uracil reductase RibD [Verrucomicrobiae bacterium]|nr:bifunctional diaminohydroxyphosphoribosylaminopyrimidine deaminase/5-amino-6-(5-phosphoribosylamino)uracil reductase RibD [Verrucomicrobiae bacterium]
MNAIPWMQLALRLAKRGFGKTSPNPMVGAVLVKAGKSIGQGYHHRAGKPHAEIEALRDAARRGHSPHGATLFVTLEPCCTQGRTPPCTEALIDAGIRSVVVGATDPNPKHRGEGFSILRQAGIRVESGVLAEQCSQLNEAFNHWIIARTPFVTVKAAMTLDGKIATAAGESKWITGDKARRKAMRLRLGSDAVLVGVNTILADDPALTLRSVSGFGNKRLRRIILDSGGRIPPLARVLGDEHAELTTVVVTTATASKRVKALSERVQVWVSPEAASKDGQRPDLRWLLQKLGSEGVTSVLVEGGGEVNASFLLGGFAHRVAFFYAPKIIGGRKARRGVAGMGASDWGEIPRITGIGWKTLGPDLLMTGALDYSQAPRRKNP